MSTLSDLFEANAASSWEKQEHFLKLIGKHQWELNLKNQEIVFNSLHRFSFQILGAEVKTEQGHVWHWSWIHSEEFSAECIHAALNLRDLGYQMAINELTTPQLIISHINGNYLSLIAMSICKANAFYKVMVDSRELYLLLYNKNLTSMIQVSSSPKQLLQTFNNLADRFNMNQRKALISYLRNNGYSCKGDTKMLEAISRKGEKIYATFDNCDRLYEVKAR